MPSTLCGGNAAPGDVGVVTFGGGGGGDAATAATEAVICGDLEVGDVWGLSLSPSSELVATMEDRAGLLLLLTLGPGLLSDAGTGGKLVAELGEGGVSSEKVLLTGDTADGDPKI